MKQKNVIVLVIDSLHFNRLGYAGHRPTPTPFLDSLFKSGLVFSNNFAVGCPTDFGLLGILTSSLPLDFGGYAEGLKKRPKTIGEVFQENGYSTGLFTLVPYASNWGHRRGYDRVFSFYDLGSYLSELEGSVRWYHDLVKLNPSDRGDYIHRCAENLELLFLDILENSHDLESACQGGEIGRSLMIHDYDFSLLAQELEKARTQLKQNPEKAVEALWDENSGNTILDFIRNQVDFRRKNPKTLRGDEKGRGMLRLALINLYKLSVFRKVSRKGRWAGRLRLELGQDVSVRFPSARYTLDQMVRWIDRQDYDKPLMAWAHLMDVHELNFTSFDVPEASEDLNEEVQRAKSQILKISRRVVGYQGSPLYDVSAHYVDFQIQRLVNALKARNLWDDTLLVLTADHGHTHVAFPLRENVHVTSHFYDELYHIPAAFVGKGIPHRDFGHLASAMDVAPTLLGFLKIPVPRSFTGFDLSATGEIHREQVFMEHMGSGHGDFRAKTILMCVRSQSDKIVYLQPPPGSSKPGYVREWYDLKDDPEEKKNLSGKREFSSEVLRLIHLARERLAKVYLENQLGSPLGSMEEKTTSFVLPESV